MPAAQHQPGGMSEVLVERIMEKHSRSTADSRQRNRAICNLLEDQVDALLVVEEGEHAKYVAVPVHKGRARGLRGILVAI